MPTTSGAGSVVLWAKATDPVSDPATSNAPVSRALRVDLFDMILMVKKLFTICLPTRCQVFAGPTIRRPLLVIVLQRCGSGAGSSKVSLRVA